MSNDDLVHPDLPHCVRCGEAIRNVADMEDVHGGYTCDEWHGHDEDGVFAPVHYTDPAHPTEDDDTYFIVFDGTDDCRYDSDSGDWVVPSNPFTP